MNVRFLSAADEEVDAAARWYEVRREGLGLRFLAELDDAIDAIESRPTQFPVHPFPGTENIRRRLLNRFPMPFVYDVRETECVILAVAHLARRYWRSRGDEGR